MNVTTSEQTHPTAECLKVSQVLARIGDKWSLLIVTRLGEGPLRFGQLLRSIEDISQRMLTRTLRGLERDGLVQRTVIPSLPPRVEYELTELGRSLQGPVTVLSTWAAENLSAIDAARASYDREPG
ncbi:helix-turn-helix transcriptional regulator [Pelagibacterium sp. 26DY04]|uniref:winged helix-turn-helix transcriptional regulator n=1 Tax=unclassified Pelagibacterium TaxID=2623280 RepID=UPI002816311D|nr:MULTISPECIES: helix-turn-helix domain-containing protein [unclassified Pelagibacterium]WMT87784.1 helix-turn-helix transcriptional regulator [Pelagibacterium sp. 26DY04]WMT91450.1 helix-turn-helix transcriptional regulator [Pelagibacterium sp. H642]